MAVVFDSASEAAGAAVTTLTWALTTSGSDRGLIVDVTYYHTAARTVSGVTYAGVAMTSIGGITRTGFNMRTEQWKLSAPASGANNVVVTMNGSTSELQCGAISVTGAHQTTASLTGTQATAQGNSAAPSVGVAAGGTDELVIDSVVADGPVAFTAGAGQTRRWHQPASIGGAGSTEAGVSGTVTMSWATTSGEWAICGVSVKPAATAGGTGRLVNGCLINGLLSGYLA